MVEAAAKLLWAQGFHATGLQQIVKESDTPRGSLYFHFPGGKEQLAVEALRAAGRRMTDTIERALATHDDLVEALRDFVGLFVGGMQKSDYQRGCPLATVALETSATSDEIRRACDEQFSEWRGLIAARLRSRGSDAERADALATLTLSAIEGALILSRAARDTKPLEDVGDQLVALFRAEPTATTS
jgi:TetR/AcrR family transcriptional repressor of lmrAB and yxaGH operons